MDQTLDPLHHREAHIIVTSIETIANLRVPHRRRDRRIPEKGIKPLNALLIHLLIVANINTSRDRVRHIIDIMIIAGMDVMDLDHHRIHHPTIVNIASLRALLHDTATTSTPITSIMIVP